MKKRNYIIYVVAVVVLLTTASCSIKKMAMNQVAGALTGPGSSTVFTGDNDPELVADALPFAIKMYESLLAAIPAHAGLQLQTGSLYVMYANAFIQTPAEMMGEGKEEEHEFMLARAKNLYLRGRDMLMDGLETRYPGFLQKMKKKK
ncbi:MAG: hypothetical protein GY757_03665, partial [bacterium]|nr:hypothetical protein [bacterium]